MAIEEFSANLESQIGQIRGVVNQLDSLFGQLAVTVKAPFDEANKAVDTTKERLKSLMTDISSFKNDLQKDFSSAFKDAIKNGTGFADTFTKIGLALEDLVLQLGVVNPLLNSLFGGARGTLADIGDITSSNFKESGLIGSLFGGIFDLFEGRAGGGPVMAGTPYMVGERGPEIFVPQVGGRIASNAGAAPVSITLNIATPDAASFRASQTQIAASMIDAARRAQRIR